jgi:VWFA-related protein
VIRLKRVASRVALVATLSLLLTSRGTLSSSADGELTLQVTGVDTSEYPTVRLSVTVIDQNGRSPEDLGAANFKVEVAGKRLPIAAVDSSAHGDLAVSSLLVIDTSGSMQGQAIEAARQAASAFITSLRAVDEVGVMSFAGSVVTLSPFTTDFASANRSLSSLNALGNTALYEAVADAAQLSKQHGTQRQAIVLVSDGADFGGVSAVSRAESLAAAESGGVPFYVVGFGEAIDRSYLQELADASRGHLYIAPAIDELRSVFADISQQVLTQYAVTLDLTGTDFAGSLPATLTVDAGGAEDSVDLEFPLPEPEAVVVPQQVAAAPLPDPEPSSGSDWPWLVAIAGAALVVVGYIGRRLVLVRTEAQEAIMQPPTALSDSHQPTSSRDGDEVLGRLVAPDGTHYDLFRHLVSFGADEESTYRWPASDPDLGASTIRVWYGSERFVVHDTSARTRLKLNGRRSQWAFLEDGDELELNGLKLRFQSCSET